MSSQETPQRQIDNWFDEEDDEDDDIYQPATDGDEESTLASTIMTGSGMELEEDGADEEDGHFTDARESFPAGDIELVLEDEGEATETEGRPAGETAGPAGSERAILHLQALIGGQEGLQRLLAHGNYRIITFGGTNLRSARAPTEPDEEIDDEDSDDSYFPHRFGHRRRHRRVKPLNPDRFPPIPNPAGRALQASGVFGSTDARVEKVFHRKASLSQRLLWRRLGISPRATAARQNRLICQDMIPNTTLADSIIHYDSRAYSGEFSDDGNFFFSCTQNFKVQMYDTSNPYEWRYYKTVDFPFGQWTITDATLSPDNRFLAYSSIRHTVCLAPTDPNAGDDDTASHTLLDFTNYAPGAVLGDSRPAAYMGRQGFGIWSLRFSGDGREIVAGTSDHNVLVYDLETRQTTLKLHKHGDDVNAVCFGDKASPHILFSGSDDQTLRVWDRRSMADGREAGVFVGHTEGLTYVDSKGDGRYVLSNGKDQMMKLWDLRRMVSPGTFDGMNISRYTTNFDYRFSHYNLKEWEPNPDDCSVTTYRGHSVLKTLIRCHFSPPGSTNSRYVYSGSEDGKVYIWNLDGTQKATIDVFAATRETRPKTSRGGHDWDWDMGYSGDVWKTCVRDASWSPSVPVIAATSWNGWGLGSGTVSVHSWNDSPFVPSPAAAASADPSSSLKAKRGDVGAVSGSWIDTEDDGDPEMGMSYNARLELRPGFRRSGARAKAERAWGRQTGHGLRINPVRRVRMGVDDDEDGRGGW